jgi:hypothetical protein
LGVGTGGDGVEGRGRKEGAHVILRDYFLLSPKKEGMREEKKSQNDV